MFMLQLAEEHRIKQIAISWINIKDENYIVFQFQSQLPRHKWKLQLVLFVSLFIMIILFVVGIRLIRGR